MGSLCHDTTGFHVSLMAEDKHIFSPWHECNDHVFSRSDVLEAFITPVTSIFDSPQQYYELDTSPTGALFGALVGNRLGNSSTAVANPSIIGNRTCDPPARSLSLSSSSPIHDCAIRCSGAAKFPEGLTASATVAQGGYTVELLVPWALFDRTFQPRPAPWPTWRMNFYRYDYPSGPNANYTNYELSAWSPTHSGGFHVPSAFGHVVLR